MARASVRIVTTNDFVGSFSPVHTSYGTLPGGEGLKSALKSLRKGTPTIWADVGDFSQGGPLAALSHGVAGFKAAAQLGIDVAVVGNHEFDWGIPLVLENAPRLGFPLLCANANVGLPATAIIPTSAGDVGFIGITHPDCHTLALYRPVPNSAFPMPERDVATIVFDTATYMRRQGIDFIVVMLHDGLDWSISSTNQYIIDATRFARLCRPWIRIVDVVLAGHTLGRYIGHIDATPVLQPWAFGAELGVIELVRGEQDHKLYGVLVPPGEDWSGFGKDLIECAKSEVVGVLREPLYDYSNGDTALVKFLAKALYQAMGMDAAILCVGCNQPVINGVIAMLHRGPITQLDLLRTVSWTDGAIWYGEIAYDEWFTICTNLHQSPALAWGTKEAESMSDKDTVTVTAPSGYVTALLSKIVGRQIAWIDSGNKLDQVVRKAMHLW